MKLRTLLAMAGKSGLFLRMQMMSVPAFRMYFLSAAASCGILERLRRGPASLDELAAEFAPRMDLRDSLEAWLRFGVSLRQLRIRDGRYSLRSSLAKSLANPVNDAFAALFEEMCGCDRAMLMDTPALLRSGRKWKFAEQEAYGPLIARSSRIVEPIVYDALDAIVPARGPIRLLEIRCGSGCYIRYCAERNSELTAVGVELQPEVAELARHNIGEWGLGSRVAIEAGDIRDRAVEPSFDLVTLHNNIYYFPVNERAALARKLGSLLRPGGQLLITTACQNRDLGSEILNLWSAATEGCGRLPRPDEMVAQLQEAGLLSVTTRRLVPFLGFYSFVGSSPMRAR
jgi:SAM-dependent methyltransferase